MLRRSENSHIYCMRMIKAVRLSNLLGKHFAPLNGKTSAAAAAIGICVVKEEGIANSMIIIGSMRS